jgi:non-ribosomal peptide synthetase component E (peptide arylation enzyme)
MIRVDPANPYHPSIGAALRKTARSLADEVFLISDDERLTFNDVDRVVDRLASGLLSIGIGRGEVGFAFIEPSAGVEVTVEQILGACTGQIADYNIPR